VKFLLDTNIISEIRKRDRAHPNVARWVARTPAGEIGTSVIVLAEIRRGIELKRRRDPEQAKSLDRWFLQMRTRLGNRVLPIDEPVAEAWALLAIPNPLPLIDGLLAATAKVDATGNHMGVVAALKGVSLGPLLKDQVGKETLDGHGEVKLDITTDGPTVGALRKALDGTASLALRDGAVHGINVAQKLRDLKSTFSGGGTTPAQAADASEKTDFSEMTASFVIRKGVATNNDLLAKSPLLRLGGAGTIDIGAGSLDYTVKATVVATLAGQGGNDLSQLNGVTLPVHLTGPFAAMSYQLDWSSVATQAIKSKAADKVKSLLGDKLKPGKDPSKITDALKGLLGK